MYSSINERSVKYFDNQSLHTLFKRKSEEILGHEFSCDVRCRVMLFMLSLDLLWYF